MKPFVLDYKYVYVGTGDSPRKGSGATRETKWECVAVGERYVLLYFDGRKCGKKETFLTVEHFDGNWQKA